MSIINHTKFISHQITGPTSPICRSLATRARPRVASDTPARLFLRIAALLVRKIIFLLDCRGITIASKGDYVLTFRYIT